MRKITLIILHCSATREDRRFTFDDCKRDHTQNRKYKDIGYHFYIELDGKMTEGRPIETIGAHCLNHNKHSIGICLEGGLDKFGNFADTRTGAQEITLLNLLARLKVEYPNALIVGHNTLDPDRACPCFDTAEYRELFP
ncbi:MAG: N-acetylmuramoyl-L-alanine amidase [Bacteroidaceae bacterium]|nr:N-acetylmuramoyl-L-alanine amidase [Bacteroidaceae bacterium]